jgi:hypothetical protein
MWLDRAESKRGRCSDSIEPFQSPMRRCRGNSGKKNLSLDSRCPRYPDHGLFISMSPVEESRDGTRQASPCSCTIKSHDPLARQFRFQMLVYRAKAEPILYITTLQGLGSGAVRAWGVSNQRICPILVRELVYYEWWVGSRGNQEGRPQSPSLQLPPTSFVPPPGPNLGPRVKTPI